MWSGATTLSTGSGRSWRNSSYGTLSVVFANHCEQMGLGQFTPLRVFPGLYGSFQHSRQGVSSDLDTRNRCYPVHEKRFCGLGVRELGIAFELGALFMNIYVGHMWTDHAEEYKSPSVGGDRIKSVCPIPSHRVSMRPTTDRLRAGRADSVCVRLLRYRGWYDE